MDTFVAVQYDGLIGLCNLLVGLITLMSSLVSTVCKINICHV